MLTVSLCPLHPQPCRELAQPVPRRCHEHRLLFPIPNTTQGHVPKGLRTSSRHRLRLRRISTPLPASSGPAWHNRHVPTGVKGPHGPCTMLHDSLRPPPTHPIRRHCCLSELTSAMACRSRASQVQCQQDRMSGLPSSSHKT